MARTTTKTLSDARAAGAEKARAAIRIGLDRLPGDSFEWARRNYPAAAHLDFAAEVLALDRARMASPPDIAKYPETKGLPDLLVAERAGFLEVCGGDELAMAYSYTWQFFYSRRLNTRYVGSPVGSAQCSAAFIRDSSEGGPLYGRNWDVPMTPWAKSLLEPPREAADGKRVMFAKGVSCSVMLDEEPDEIFPVDPWEMLPDYCTTTMEAVEFLDRYRAFWGPGNSILVDSQLDSVALEKANCRLGVRRSEDGTAAVTALSFTDPDMKAFKEERDRLSIARRGWTIDEAPDWRYWRGADARYERLLALVSDAAAGSPTLADMARIMTDHAVPYPARVCLAGESTIPGVTPDEAEWTACSHSEILEGPNRRMHFFAAEGGQPCYANPPYLVPGRGVEVRAEWQQGTRPLPAVAVTPRPRYHAEYPTFRRML